MVNFRSRKLDGMVLVGSSILLMAAHALAGPMPLTVPDAIEAGRRNSPELRRLELAVEAASWKKWETLSGHLPQFALNSNYFLAAKYPVLSVSLVPQQPAITIPSAYPQTNIEVSGSWTFFDGLGTWNLYQAAALGHEAAELELRSAQFHTAESIRVKFFHALAAQQLAEVANQNIETLEHHLHLVEVSEQAGTGTRVDVLRLKAQLEEARAEKILADDNVELAKRILGEVMGLNEAPQTLSASLPVPDENKVARALELKVQDRQDYQAQAKREAASDRMNAAGWGPFAPRISLFAVEQFYGYNSTFSPSIVATQGLNNASALGLKLTWNLFDGGSSIARKAQLDAQAKQTVELTRKMLLSATSEFETWKRRYHYNVALFRARQRSVEQSEESVRLAEISVKAGTKTHSEVLDAERDLFRSRAGVIQAQLAAAEALSNLELALGHAI